MRGAEVIDNGTIIVKDGRIEQIGPADRIRVPDGAEVIIVDGKTIIPGLIDVHAHLTVIPRDLLVENHWEPLAYLAFGRSEEHTSELQSLMPISYAVFCLKKQTKIINTIYK